MKEAEKWSRIQVENVFSRVFFNAERREKLWGKCGAKHNAYEQSVTLYLQK